MCFKKKEVIISKFQMKDMVKFRYRDDLVFGYVYSIKKVDGNVVYDIQLGGQCPAVIYNISEQNLSEYKLK